MNFRLYMKSVTGIFYSKKPLFMDMLLNIYLVLTGARRAALLEYTNIKSVYSTDVFFKKITRTLMVLNSIYDTELTFIEESVLLNKPNNKILNKYPRLLIIRKEDYHEIIKWINPFNYDYTLGVILDMTHPGLESDDYLKPRLLGSIYINDEAYLYAETFVVTDYNWDYKVLEDSLKHKVKKYNESLKHFDIICNYKIKYDNGVSIRKDRLYNQDLLYVKDNIDQYINDIYNEHDYIKGYENMLYNIADNKIVEIV